VPGQNLTRDEARARADLIAVESYDVALDFTTGDETFATTTRVRFACRNREASTFIDLIAPSVREVVLNGRSLDPATVVTDGRIELSGLAAANELRVVADAAYMRTGEGMHRFADPVDDNVYLYSQFEVADARRVFACFDQPDLKATFAFTVAAPAGWEVVSNSPAAPPEPAGESAAIWRFAPTPRLSTYVTAIVAGPYHIVRDEHRDIPLAVYCRRSLAEHLDADEIFAVTKAGFDFFEHLFDVPYPFEKYDQLFVPEFNAGAMENAACVTILEDYVFRSKQTDYAYERRSETILHELAHMWFGDLVTMRWWNDLWLNESFATYVSVLSQAERTRWTNAWTTFANVEKTWAYRQDQLPSTHPIVADILDLEDVEVNFDGITYAKGASVLKQLVAWVGRENFFEGVRRYFQRHAWGNTTLADLLSALEQTSGRDLTSWSKEWLETAGINTLRPDFRVGDDGAFESFAVRQEAPAAHPVLRSHRLAIGLYDRRDDALVRRERIELDVTGEHTKVPQLIGSPAADLVLLNDDDLSYAKIRLDDRSLATLIAAIGEFTESLPRTLCWVAAWDMCRDAEMAARDYIRLILEGISRETDIAVVQMLLRQARSATELYVDPVYRDETRFRLAEGLDRLMRTAKPGSDEQLAYARAFSGTALSDEHLATVRGLYDGSASLEGLSVDTDLRWILLKRLAATGKAADDELDAELSRDDTATGRRHAAEAFASRPTTAAKADAWAAVVEQDSLPNAIQTATIAGFAQSHQRHLLKPYVDRYFAVIKDIWASRTNETAQNIVIGLYPTLFPSGELLDRTDRWLADDGAAPALRRLVLESRDGVARALRAQLRDREAAHATVYLG
jgi:aminopeptidase N